MYLGFICLKPVQSYRITHFNFFFFRLPIQRQYRWCKVNPSNLIKRKTFLNKALLFCKQENSGCSQSLKCSRIKATFCLYTSVYLCYSETEFNCVFLHSNSKILVGFKWYCPLQDTLSLFASMKTSLMCKCPCTSSTLYQVIRYYVYWYEFNFTNHHQTFDQHQ